jgi:hypothetical protein
MQHGYGTAIAREAPIPVVKKFRGWGIIVTIVIASSTFAMGYYTNSIKQNEAQDVRLSSLEGQIKEKASTQEMQMLIDQQRETNKRLANIETILMNGALKHGN